VNKFSFLEIIQLLLINDPSSKYSIVHDPILLLYPVQFQNLSKEMCCVRPDGMYISMQTLTERHTCPLQ